MIQVNLCAPKHFEQTIFADHTPRQIKAPFLSRPFCKSSKKIRRTVGLSGDPKCWIKGCLLSVTGNNFNDVISILYSEIDRPNLFGICTVSVVKTTSRQILTNYFNRQLGSFSFRFLRKNASPCLVPKNCNIPVPGTNELQFSAS